MVKVPFEVGELVRLKSGGPKMTVVGVPLDLADPNDRNMYQTAWSAGLKIEKAVLPEKALVAITDDEHKADDRRK